MIKFTEISFIYISLFALSQIPISEGQCFNAIVSACEKAVGTSYGELAKKNQHTFPDTEFLNKYCEKAQILVKCITEKGKTCSEEEEDVAIANNFYAILKDICNATSENGIAYRQNIGCVNGQTKDIERCIERTEEMVNSIIPGDKNRTTDDYQKINCLEMRMIKEICFLNMSQEKCGEKAHALVARLITDAEKLESKEVRKKCNEQSVKTFEETYSKRIKKELQE